MNKYDPKLYHQFIKKFGRDIWNEMFQALSIVAYGNQTFIDITDTPTEINTPCQIGNFRFEFFSFEKGSNIQRPHTAVGIYDNGTIGFFFIIKKSVGINEILDFRTKKS